MDKVVHFEIPADNISRAKKFYKGIFGWKTQDFPKMNYTILRTGEVDKKMRPKERGVINGGMMKRNKLVKNPTIFIYVNDLESSIAKIKKMKGKIIIDKTSIGEMGYIAYFKDSEGNVIGLVEGMM